MSTDLSKKSLLVIYLLLLVGEYMIYWIQELENMAQKSRFGDWIYDQLEIYDISMMNLSDYSGIHIRTLYRMANGSVKIKLEDFAWIVECISDMTNQDYNGLLRDCVFKTLEK